ncbi:MAG: DUF4123 domain-containing protein [Bacteroidetes bacterium]|nr:DUF4123 domain-containing protein [Bacteroidota bacterium]
MEDQENIAQSPDQITTHRDVKSLVGDFLLDQAERENGYLYAIVDSARNEDVFRYFLIDNVTYRSLFQDTLDEQAFGVSGFLVGCNRESILFNWLTSQVWGSSCSIFFTSQSSFDEVFKHLQNLNRVYLEDDEVVYFRYYDPRVLRVFLPTCTQRELDIFFGEVISFMMETENTDVLTVLKRNHDAWSEPLSISHYKVSG